MIAVRLTDNRLQALLALARFYFLIPPQFLRLGITTDASNLSKRVLKPLCDHRPALVQTANVGPWKPYCLTANGARLAADHLGVPEVPYPAAGVQYIRDFNHRTGCVDFQIELLEWAEASGVAVPFQHAYFQGNGAQRGALKFQALTRHVLRDQTPFVSDLEFGLQYEDGSSRLFAFEYHRGRYIHAIVEQLELHLRAMAEDVLPNHYQHPHANYLLSVYEHASTLRTTKERLCRYSIFKPFQAGFLFNSMEQVRKNFSEGWTDFAGQPSKLFTPGRG